LAKASGVENELGSSESRRRTVTIPLALFVGALLIIVVAFSIAGTYVVTRSYGAAQPVLSAVTSISTVSMTQSETSYVTVTQNQTVSAAAPYGYLYGYGPSCYPGGCVTNGYALAQCSGYKWLQSGQSCIAGSLSYQGTCLLMYDYGDGITYVLFGYGAPVATPSGAYSIAVGYVLTPSYNSSPCGGVPFQVSYFLPA